MRAGRARLAVLASARCRRASHVTQTGDIQFRRLGAKSGCLAGTITGTITIKEWHPRARRTCGVNQMKRPGTAENSVIQVALVEDDVHFREALGIAIAEASGMELTRMSATVAEGLAALAGSPADVLVVDLGLPDGSGIDVIRAAQTLWPGCAVMVSTTFGDEAHVLQSIEAGANGYLLKDSSAKKIVEEIRNLHAGGSPISPLIARQILTRFRPRSPEAPGVPRPDHPRVALSAREKEVLELCTKGFSYDEIARLLQISRHTVRTFVRRIYAKLEVSSKVEAVFEAHSQGLLTS
jgi:DNA-binding NarL/FixJ family response regulator